MYFTAVVEKHTIKCAISLEALSEHFGKDDLGPTAVFSRHRHSIERIAERLIGQRRFENNGSIFIRRYDC